MPASKAGERGKSLVSEALSHFKEVDQVLYRAALPHRAALEVSVHRRLTSKSALFEALASSITGQQLSTKAADTIWGRLRVACGGDVTPEALLRLRSPSLRKAGLSAAKAKSLKELAKAVQRGSLDLSKLRTVPEEEAITQLSSIWGIGKWTAEMFLMFALERPDVFSPGDLGLRRAIETLYDLPKDVHVRELELIASKWSPYRTIACRILWRTRDVKLTV